MAAMIPARAAVSGVGVIFMVGRMMPSADLCAPAPAERLETPSYNRAPPDGPETLKTTTKAVRPGKNLLPKAEKNEEAVVVVSPPVQTEKARLKTILVASYGWPTADMQPSRRQAARR